MSPELTAQEQKELDRLVDQEINYWIEQKAEEIKAEDYTQDELL